MTGEWECCGGWIRWRRGAFAASDTSIALTRASISSVARNARAHMTGVSVSRDTSSVRIADRATRRGTLVVLLQFVLGNWQAFSLVSPRIRLLILRLVYEQLSLDPVVLFLVSRLQELLDQAPVGMLELLRLGTHPSRGLTTLL